MSTNYDDLIQNVASRAIRKFSFDMAWWLSFLTYMYDPVPALSEKSSKPTFCAIYQDWIKAVASKMLTRWIIDNAQCMKADWQNMMIE